LELEKWVASCQVWRTSCSCQSYSMESKLSWTFSNRRRDSRQMHKILEHSHITAYQCNRYRISSLQLNVFKDIQRNRFHSWIFFKSNYCMEISHYVKSCYINWPFFPSFISFNEPMWIKYCNRSRRWNSSLLEYIS